jgi:glycine/D-amino acid oxidase-like deaminating enzyme
MRVGVIGAGVVGLSAAAVLREHGADVTCFEQDAPMAARSTGRSRIFRFAHRTAELVTHAKRARAFWQLWADRAGAPLIDSSELVVTGPDLHMWASAMADAGAPYTVVGPDSPRLRLPSLELPDELLIDHSAGVIDVDAVGAYLIGATEGLLRTEPVYAVEDRGAGARVRVPSGTADFDVVVIAAGAGTCHLAAQVGIYTPSGLAHHVRFTFPVREPGPLQCWIDDRDGALGTYQHLTGPGFWAVGGHVDLEKVAWEVGREKAAAVSRAEVLRHVRDTMPAVEPRIVDEVYCTSMPWLGDGFTIRRSGAVVAAHGQNLFKFAPLLGQLIAAEALG